MLLVHKVPRVRKELPVLIRLLPDRKVAKDRKVFRGQQERRVHKAFKVFKER